MNIVNPNNLSQEKPAVFYYEGNWYKENPAVTGPMDQSFWMASAVFDGSRAFKGLAPDLDLHCSRLIQSALKVNLKPHLSSEDVMALCFQALERLPAGRDYYIRPMFFASDGVVVPDPESTRFILAVYECPMTAEPTFTACHSSYRRPDIDMAPADAKACCLYPNIARSILEAEAKGFDSGIVDDPNGNIAEFEAANLFIVNEGVVHTPACNGTFLNGLTRQRVIKLLREEGLDVLETTLTFEDVMLADEVFNTGNLEKVMFCVQVEDRSFGIGPVSRRARELYFEYAETQTI